jgi:3-oxoacyl-(acyl-carrier-protein) synthase
MSPSTSNDRARPVRVGIYGWGVVAPGARDVAAFIERLRTGTTALAPSTRSELGPGLFVVGEPDFVFSDYADWIAQRHGAPYVSRMLAKMTDNVQFALGATIQALGSAPGLEAAVRELDEQCHVYVGSGVSDLPEAYKAAASLSRAMREWNHFWANPVRCAERRRFQTEGIAPSGASVPPDPATLPVDSEERFQAVEVWNGFWAGRSADLRSFLDRFAAIEKLGSSSDADDDAHLHAIRNRLREHRRLLEEVGCPPPPWTSVSPNLLWNIQNSPAAQITMLLGVHGPAWAPVGACSTFGVALACGRDAILRGDAKLAIVGTTDPRPDPALAAAFHQARVMPGTGEVNRPFTSLRGTHLAGGSCVWIIGDASWCEAHGLAPIGGYVESVALASDAEHIITPSKTGPRRAIVRAYEDAGITRDDVAQIDLHATGTPGDLNELVLVEDFVNPKTRVTARKGQFGHGMANSGGWELTALALDLAAGAASSCGVVASELHPRIPRPESIVAGGQAPLSGDVGVKLMLGVGGITACVVLRRAPT